MMTPLLALLLFPNISRAQAPSTPAGYVVKVDGPAVYLDLTAQTGASAGQGFVVYTEGEELKHPVTGASLGRLETKIAEGTIKEVLAMYSIGAVTSASGDLKPGMRARLGEKAAALPAPAPAPAAVPVVPTMPSSGRVDNLNRQPRWKSPSVDFQATGMAIADFKGDKSLMVALSENGKVSLFPYPFEEAKPVAVFTHPGSNVRILNLEAADLNGDGKAEIFASLYNETFTRFETVVLQLDGGELKKVAELPGMVRGHREPDGSAALAVQQLSEDLTFPFNGVYPLAFKDGKYSAGAPALKHKRTDFLFEFTYAEIDGPALLYLTSTNHLRVQFSNGHYWKTPDAYGQTPLRVRWPAVSAGRLLEFHPPMPVVYDAKKKASVFLAHNISMLGSLSEPFGLFQKGEVYRKSWTGLALEDDWKADIAGYAAGLCVAQPQGKPQELAVAVVGTAGRSSVWVYDP